MVRNNRAKLVVEQGVQNCKMVKEVKFGLKADIWHGKEEKLAVLAYKVLCSF